MPLGTFLTHSTPSADTASPPPSPADAAAAAAPARARFAVKRLIDIVLSLCLLIFLAPLLLLAALAIRLIDGRPIFDRDERVGLGGRHFDLLHFRVHRLDDDSGEWATWSSEKPERTGVGSVLHLTRVDQLPQLINILRGDLSFVGPNPERPRTVYALIRRLRGYAGRQRVRPGVTGYAQLMCPSRGTMTDADAKLAYDLRYIAEHTLAMDAWILLRTLEQQWRLPR